MTPRRHAWLELRSQIKRTQKHKYEALTCNVKAVRVRYVTIEVYVSSAAVVYRLMLIQGSIKGPIFYLEFHLSCAESFTRRYCLEFSDEFYASPMPVIPVQMMRQELPHRRMMCRNCLRLRRTRRHVQMRHHRHQHTIQKHLL